MGVLTWPADQSCGRHRTLQLGGGGEGVGDAPHSNWGDTVGQLALGGLGKEEGGGVRPAASAWVRFLLQTMSRHQPAWWSGAGWCWRPGWPGGGAAGKMLGPAPVSAAETQAAPLLARRTRSYYGRLTRTSADKCAALFPAPVAALWQMHLSADWCALLLKPFSGWMTCTVHRGRPRPFPCPASSGK